MSQQDPPNVLRIKRKRDQDPLQALILEDSSFAKRSKPSSPRAGYSTPPPSENRNLYFKLARTDNFGVLKDEMVIQSILSESSVLDTHNAGKSGASTGKRKFVIPKRQSDDDSSIPNELSDMLDSFLKVEEQISERKKRIKKSTKDSQEQPSTVGTDEEQSDYVYDVYHLSSNEPLTTANHPQSQIGYIRFFDDNDENGLYQSDDENNKPNLYSDDEDSNSEGFYQNDYPSDEDAGVYSETYSDELEDESDELPADLAESVLFTKSGTQDEDESYEELYNNYYDDNDFEDIGFDVNFLPEDEFNNQEEEIFERNKFFETDKDDDLAIHRDRIFGRLQRMIDDN